MSVLRALAFRWRLSGADFAVLGYASAYVLLLLLVPRWPSMLPIAVAMFFPMGAIALAAQWTAAHAPALEAADRRAWRWVMAGSSLVWLSGMAWTTVLRSGADRFTNSSVDGALDLLASACLIVGMLQFPVVSRLRDRGPRVVLDAALLGVAWLAMAWHFGVLPLRSDARPLDASALVQLLATWPEVAVAAWVYLRVGDHPRRHAVGALLGAMVLSALADFLWGEVQGRYVPGHWVDLPWFLAWLLRWRAGRLAVSDLSAAPLADAPDDRRGMTPTAFVAGAYLSLIVAVVLGRSAGTWSLALSAVAMTALLLIRQGVELRDTRRLAAATLASAARYRALLERSNDFVLLVDSALRVRYGSPSAARIGLATEGASFEQSVHPDDVSSVRSWLQAVADQPPLRCRLNTPTHGAIDVELRAHDRRTDPRMAGWVINGRDISTEVDLQRRLRHAQKLAALHEMAGRVAHSYNNALSTVLGHAELMRSELAVGNPWRDDVEQIHAAATRGAAITRQLLGFSDAHESQPVPIDVGILTRDLVSTIERLLPSAVTLEIVLPENAPIVVADRSHLEQVLVNLVTNARDAMPAGGTVRISWTVDSDAFVSVHVADHGTGIAESALARVFDPFFTTKAPGRGTGLGLAMVEAIVRRSGGRVTIDTAVDVGTTVHVQLPRAGVAVADVGTVAVRTTGSNVPIPSLPAIVLLVDDEADVRRVTRRILERAGFVVIEADGGTAAVAITQDLAVSIDVLVTDIMMPGISGRDVIGVFRKRRPGVPIVCMTGFAPAVTDGESLADVVHKVIEKPFTSATLTQAVTSAIASTPPTRP